MTIFFLFSMSSRARVFTNCLPGVSIKQNSYLPEIYGAAIETTFRICFCFVFILLYICTEAMLHSSKGYCGDVYLV